MPQISFIMPVYNTRAEWLKRAVNSVREQTVEDWELLLIDDGSRAETARICDELGNQDERIRIFHQRNQGPSVARNCGMDNAEADWVAFIDADDWIVCDYAEQLLNILEKYDLEVCAFGHDDIRGTKTVHQLRGDEEFHIFMEEEKDQMQLMLLLWPGVEEKYSMFFGAQWNMVYSRNFLNRFQIRNIPELRKSEDAVFNLYVLEYAEKIAYYNRILYFYFINNESVTGSYSEDISRYHKLLSAYRDFLEKTGKGGVFKKAYLFNAMLQFEGALSAYFFHQENKDTKAEKKERMRCFLMESPYREILKEKTPADFGIYKKWMFYFMKWKCYTGIYFLYILKQRLKEKK